MASFYFFSFTWRFFIFHLEISPGDFYFLILFSCWCLHQGYWRNRKRACLASTRYWDRNPDTPVRYGVVGNISACHADARGSIPRFGVLCFCFAKNKIKTTNTVRLPFASIAQLAEHALSKRKVTSSILVGGFVRMV